MNCNELRKYVHPYLDDELDVQRNLEILEHLNACDPCRELFDAEEAAWERVRLVASAEKAPPRFRDDLQRALNGIDQRPSWKRAAAYLVPLTAAATVALVLLLNQETQTPHGGHTIEDHGAGIAFAVSHFNRLRADATGAGTTLLSREFLDRHDDMERLDAEGARKIYRELVGPAAVIPSTLRGKRIHGAVHQASMNGRPVPGLLLSDQREQEYGLYVLDANQAEIKDMHPLGSDGVHSAIRLDRCRGCHVIAVTRGDRVFIFVTQARRAVEDAIALARETF